MPIALHLRRSRPIDAGELEAALRRAGIDFERSKANDDAWWIRYPADAELYNSRTGMQPPGELWFRAALEPEGAVVLSVSVSNCHLLRNLRDMVDRLPALAARLGARLHVGSREVDDRTKRALLRDGDAFVTNAEQAHAACLAAIDELPMGAIEIPIGHADCVEEYALFEVATEDPVTRDQLKVQLEDWPLHVVREKGRGLYLGDDEGIGAAIFQREDGSWQVRPVHGRSPWRVHARAMMSAVRSLWILGRGAILWQGAPLDAELQRAIEERSGGSALEFALWCQTVRPARIVPSEGS